MSCPRAASAALPGGCFVNPDLSGGFKAGYRNRVTIERLHLVIDYGAGREVQTSLTELGYGGWG
jgi:hypothetical protein